MSDFELKIKKINYDTTEVDVVIISYAKTAELKIITERGLQSLLESDDVKFNVFVVESNQDVNYDEYTNTKTIYTNDPFGYNKYLNIGVSQGTAPFVCLCNSDLTYQEGWASNIISAMNKDKFLLSASPFCPQTQDETHFDPSLIYYGKRVRVELAGWCIFQKRKIYERIGKLDERFIFWYADNDYGLTLEKYGVVHALIPNSIVNHHEYNLGKTGDSILSAQEKNDYTVGQYQIFKDKWK